MIGAMILCLTYVPMVSSVFIKVSDTKKITWWAQGRYLATSSSQSMTAGKQKVKAPIVLSQDGTAMDQEELLQDMALTPNQLKGKQKIKERTQERAKAKQDEE